MDKKVKGQGRMGPLQFPIGGALFHLVYANFHNSLLRLAGPAIA